MLLVCKDWIELDGTNWRQRVSKVCAALTTIWITIRFEKLNGWSHETGLDRERPHFAPKTRQILIYCWKAPQLIHMSGKCMSTRSDTDKKYHAYSSIRLVRFTGYSLKINDSLSQWSVHLLTGCPKLLRPDVWCVYLTLSWCRGPWVEWHRTSCRRWCQ